MSSTTSSLKKYSPLLVCVLMCCTPMIALASGDTPVGEGLDYIIKAIYGSTGIAIATLSIIFVGLLCLGHYLEWTKLVYTVAGVGIIFGAGAIVSGIKSLIHN